MDWPTIDTAPRDGTKIFISWPGCMCAPLVSWQCLEGGEPSVFMWALEDDILDVGQQADGWIGFDGDPVPTHWMPVPGEKTAATPEDPAERGAPGSNTGV